MAVSAKLAPDSLLTVEDQERLYRQECGEEAAARQVRLRRLEQGKCVCEPRSVRRRWDGRDRATARKVHDRDCPRWQPWMNV